MEFGCHIQQQASASQWKSCLLSVGRSLYYLHRRLSDTQRARSRASRCRLRCSNCDRWLKTTTKTTTSGQQAAFRPAESVNGQGIHSTCPVASICRRLLVHHTADSQQVVRHKPLPDSGGAPHWLDAFYNWVKMLHKNALSLHKTFSMWAKGHSSLPGLLS